MLTSFGVLPPAIPFANWGATACPPRLPSSPPAPAPPRPKYKRYSDPQLQVAYARIVAALRKPTVAGVHVIDDDEADEMARYLIDAGRELPESRELLTRARCNYEPYIAAAAAEGARGAVGRLMLGAFTVLLAGGVAFGVWRLNK